MSFINYIISKKIAKSTTISIYEKCINNCIQNYTECEKQTNTINIKNKQNIDECNKKCINIISEYYKYFN